MNTFNPIQAMKSNFVRLTLCLAIICSVRCEAEPDAEPEPDVTSSFHSSFHGSSQDREDSHGHGGSQSHHHVPQFQQHGPPYSRFEDTTQSFAYPRTTTRSPYQQPTTRSPFYQPTPPPSPYRQPTAPPQQPRYSDVPACAQGSPYATYCVDDREYPEYEINRVISDERTYEKLRALYKDVVVDVRNSVDFENYEQETYLCPSETAYIKPKRAINSQGEWSIIVNDIKVNYNDVITQSARVETCSTPGDACPLLPSCIQSHCGQKHVYHRFLVYIPPVSQYDSYDDFPFAIQSFRLPSACACATIGADSCPI